MGGCLPVGDPADRMTHIAGTHFHNSDDRESNVEMASRKLGGMKAHVIGFSLLEEGLMVAKNNSLGIFLPLIAANCSILGGSLFMQQREYPTLLHATAFGVGSGIGWFLAIVGLAAIREKIRYSNVPVPLRGLGITFIITGLMGIAFMSFLGIKL